MPDITLKFDDARAVKIALCLREIETLLPAGDRSFTQRRRQLLWLAREFEAAVKDAAPDLPKHQRPKRNSKSVWCQGEGCTRALTLEHARESPLCPVCRGKLPAA